MKLNWMPAWLLACVMPFTLLADAPLEFALPDMRGELHSLDQYRGQWVVVNYWATWCPPCLEEIPDLVDFHERNRGEAVVVGVNYEDIGTPQLAAFVERHLVSYPVLRAAPFEDSPLGSIPGLPTTFVIDPEGHAVARQVGPITGEQLEAYIEARKGKANERRGGGSR
jgi:thiol-disulfide isomerase/thioredoxin